MRVVVDRARQRRAQPYQVAAALGGVDVVGIGEDDESILRGVEMAASHGVMTFIVPHNPTTGAIFEDMDAPTADRMISVYEQAVRIYEKYGLDLDVSQSGCVRGGGFSAIKDVAKFGV